MFDVTSILQLSRESSSLYQELQQSFTNLILLVKRIGDVGKLGFSRKDRQLLMYYMFAALDFLCNYKYGSKTKFAEYYNVDLLKAKMQLRNRF